MAGDKSHKIFDSTLSEDAVYEKLCERFLNIIPSFELREKSALVVEINRLKKEQNTVILGHNYMEPVLYVAVTDYVGDSLELSRYAAKVLAPRIVFCGVRFMAETAKALSPEKEVLLPTDLGGCSLAGSITAKDVRALKERFPGSPVVTYVNCYAAVKAETDICCTSGNAEKIIASLNDDIILFLPDRFLAANVGKSTGRKVFLESDRDLDVHLKETLSKGEKVLITWNGECEVHEKFQVEDIVNARRTYPGLKVLSHPECREEVVSASDFSGSTAKMINYVKDLSHPEKLLLLTECSMADNIEGEFKGKAEFVRMCSVRCPHMNEITLACILKSLRTGWQSIDLPSEVIANSQRSLLRMLQF